MKIPILGEYRKSIFSGMFPNSFIGHSIKAMRLDMAGAWKETANLGRYTIGEILIQQ